MDQFPLTRASLLFRLRDRRDSLAWSEFVEVYAPLVYQYARNHGVQDADAADVTQEVLRTCSHNLQKFQYDRNRGKFRSWLFTVVRTRLSNYRKSQYRHPQGRGDSEFSKHLEQFPAPMEDEEEQWVHEYQMRLFQWAATRIRSEFRRKTWRAFELTALEGKAPKDVAERLKMSVGAVYVAKTRVLKRIRTCVEKIDAESLEDFQ